MVICSPRFELVSWIVAVLGTLAAPVALLLFFARAWGWLAFCMLALFALVVGGNALMNRGATIRKAD